MLVTVTLNAAIDKRYEVRHARSGSVNRIETCTMSAGGKGLNVARVMAIAGEAVTAFGFAGGHNGRLLEELAQRNGIHTEFVSMQGETRTCINIYDRERSEQTEFLEPGAVVTREEYLCLEQSFEEVLKQADLLTISGSMPQGIDPDCYNFFIKKAKDAGIPVLLDTSGEPLKRAISVCPDLIKPNQDEIEQLLGHKLRGQTELYHYGRSLCEAGIQRVVISLGAEGSLLITKDEILQAKMPVLAAVNTVGCGDTMLAGLAIGIHRGWADEELLKYASALAGANALRKETGYFKKEDFEAIYKQIEIIRGGK